MTREVVLLGSTGSIGTQAIDVAVTNPDKFRVVGLAAGGDRPELLAEQVLDLGVEVVGVAKPAAVEAVAAAITAVAASRGYRSGDFAMPKLLGGPEAAAEIAAWSCDLVLNAMTGSIGLAPTLAALAAGHMLALANKESYIAGGQLVAAAAKPGQIVPVDSEHSAIAQCLRSGAGSEVRRLVLTASGGPFRGKQRVELAEVTLAQAMAHPTWEMGPVNTINSATLINKGLEIIEAYWLFDIDYDQIDVVVHPQSIIHSMVEFVDGSTIAQVSPPDMHLPIALAMAWPDRVDGAAPAVDWTAAATWTFESLDNRNFPAVELAKAAGKAGGSSTAVLNAANEEAVAAFVSGQIGFNAIVDTVAAVLDSHETLMNVSTLAEVTEAEDWARRMVHERIAKGSSA